MTNRNLPHVFSVLKKEAAKWTVPIVTFYAEKQKDPYKVLISTMISLRTKDAVTSEATNRLWALAQTPDQMRKLPVETIAQAIYPAGFYLTKARNISQVSDIIANKYNNKVPDEIDELVKFKGVGRKTANLVVSKGFGKPAICVDTHVHRIVNRWAYVNTKTPDETETVLRRKLPLKYWLVINDLLVAYGQNLCVPISPYCSRCKFHSLCAKKGVKTRR